MTNDAYEATWRSYQAAWSDISDAERENLLNSTVSADCEYADPTSQTHSRKELIARIQASQERFPGASFNTTNFLFHHGQALAEWTMFDASGKPFVTGTSWARYGNDGRLTNFTGFFKTPPSVG